MTSWLHSVLTSESHPCSYASRVFGSPDILEQILHYSNFKAKAAVSQTSKESRIIVGCLFDRTVNKAVSRYFEGNRSEAAAFLGQLHSVRGYILCHLPEEVVESGSTHATREHTPNCLTLQDLVVIVEDRHGMTQILEWLLKRGYCWWRGRLSQKGLPTPQTDFVVGSTTSNGVMKVCLVILVQRSVRAS